MPALVLLSVALFLLVTSVLPAHAAQCQHSGKVWRLVDGKRCWLPRWMPKDNLHWAKPNSVMAKPNSVKVTRPPRFRAAPLPRPVPAPIRASSEPPEREEVRNEVSVAEALEAKAEELRAQLDAPKPVRTILISPYPTTNAPPQDIPMPRPRPRPPLQAHAAYLPWMPLVLLLLLIGTAAAERGTNRD